MFCFIAIVTKLSWVGNFLSYGFAPASVVAPLGTVVSQPTRIRREMLTIGRP